MSSIDTIGETLLATTQDRFRSETDPDGAPWTPLAPATVARRGSARPILRVRGRLYGSLNYQVEGSTLRLGPNSVYAAVQQFGHTFNHGKGKGASVPARAYVGFGKEDEAATTDAVADWFSLP